ncbi:enoyl-CoA hydratase/isomerase family protein [Cytobacillus purgationiresistens]|uniref:2-(1,2-epoxy-1,2-dihydrophenyl)acetyl-CoA isomerase n=1 Tax=Cytobacillus purgationiresistens TaxID=863449 RepID=A0ABU0AEI8_9BACI|nr:enoyl-CoA hydratase/isomerase family protein [Cytobacillus purgationiresistens]MDQ0269668.1 2-(1,2-epoxy-1,2-dihydrophenyl)acetyl-CoA isomerase [Cytobacillus purgationiresistens]
MSYQYIEIEVVGSTKIIYLNRPDVRNALGMEMRMELLQALEVAEADPEVKCIILSGKGKAFSAGGDLSALSSLSAIEGRKRLQKSHQLIMKILEIEKPIIAAVNGAAAGAGFSLMLLCDLSIVSDKAFFVQSFVNVGLVPDFAAVHFLPLIIGHQKAKELMFLGDRVTAEEAHKLGIVNQLSTQEDLIKNAIALADRLAAKSPLSIGMTKKLMNEHMNVQLKMFLEMEAQAQGICFQTNDFKEGVDAFFTKRNPMFLGK